MKNKFKPYVKYLILFLILIILILQIEKGNNKNITPQSRNNNQSQSENTNYNIAKKVKVDLYNNSVTDKMRKNQKPKRGGTLRVRIPGNPTVLNPVLSSDYTSSLIHGYLFDSLVNRDRETLEFLPWIAKYWEVRDLVVLKNGRQIYGKITNRNNTNVTIEPYTKITFAKKDLKEINKNSNSITLLNGKVYYGKIKVMQYTVEIETKIKNQNTIKIGLFEIKKTERKMGRRKWKEPMIVPEAVFIFHMRKNVEWHDSTPQKRRYVTADDVIFSYNAIMNPYIDAQRLRAYYMEISSVNKINNHTVRFTYKKPYFSAFEICSSMSILPKHRYRIADFAGDKISFGKAFNRHRDNRKPIGNGPYILEKWDFSKVVILKRNKNYWASKAGLPYWKKGQPYLDRIMFVIILNKQAALKALLKGQIDLDFSLEPSEWVDPMTNSPDFKKRFVRANDSGMIYTYIGWNNKSPFFRDKRVRQAMTMLIPREKILKQIHFGLGAVTTGPLYPKSPAFNQSIEPYEYNPQKAAKLLSQAGWIDLNGDGIREKNGVKFEFEYLIHNMRDYHQRIADIIKEHVEQANVKMLIRKLDWSIFIQKVSEQKFDAVRLAWSMSLDPDLFQIFHSSQAKGQGSNYINFINSEADQLLEQARQTFDNEKRWNMYKKFHSIMHGQQPYTFLFNLSSLIFYRKEFRGVKLYYSAYPFNFNEWYYSGKINTKKEKKNYNLIGIILLLLIGGAVYFFIYKMNNIYKNKV